MGEIILFRLVLRSPDISKPITTEVLIFPYSRRHSEIERHAREMRRLDPDRMEVYLTRVLEEMCAELSTLGIECEACECEAIDDLASAIGRALHGPDFQLEEVAQ